MATAAATGEGARGRRLLASVALFALSAISILYLVFLYEVYNDPAIRETGFAGPSEIWRYSWLVIAFLIIFMVAIWTKWVPVAPQALRAASPAPPPSPQAPLGARLVAPRAALDDPSSRPGAPPSLAVPAVPPELLPGGWRRYNFPAERTGGVYIDADVIVDDDSRAPADPETPRGKTILRVRDEVARVCVRCELIDHCHSKVAALIEREEMLGNHECVPGLKKIAAAKIEAMRARAAAPPQAAAPAPEVPAAPAAPAAADLAPLPDAAEIPASVESGDHDPGDGKPAPDSS